MVLIHHVVECRVSSGESTNVMANAIGQNDRSSIKRTVIWLHPHKKSIIMETRHTFQDGKWKNEVCEG